MDILALANQSLTGFLNSFRKDVGGESDPPGGGTGVVVVDPPADPAAAPDPDAPDPDAADPDAPDPDAADPDAADPDTDATDPDAPDPDAADPDAAAPDATTEEAEAKELEEIEGQRRVGADGKPLTINKVLKDVYAENPGLRDFLKKPENKAIRYDFMRAVELNKVFPTIPDAHAARASAEEFQRIDNLFFSKDPQDHRQFIKEIFKASEEAGSGSYEGIRGLFVADLLGEMIEKAQATAQRAGVEPKHLQLAAAIIGRAMGIPNYKDFKVTVDGAAAAEEAGNAKLTPEMKKFYQDRDDFEAKQTRDKQQTERAEFDNFTKDIGSKLKSHLEKQLEGIISKTAIKGGIARLLKKEIVADTIKEIYDDNLFNNRVEKLVLSGKRTPKEAENVLLLLTTRSNHVLPARARALLREAGITMKAEQEKKQERQADGARRREPASTGGPGKPGSGAGKEKSPGTHEDDVNFLMNE
jgi:hypothetical protein